MGVGGRFTRLMEKIVGEDVGNVALFHHFRDAGFQTCGVADFPVGRASIAEWFAGLETRDTAGLEACATLKSRIGPAGRLRPTLMEPFSPDSPVEV